MRINANYLDRFAFSILIYTVPITALIIFINYYSHEIVNWKPFVFLMLLFSSFVWLIDTAVCEYRFHPEKVVAKNGDLYINGQKVYPDQIKSIVPIIKYQGKWRFEVVQITVDNEKLYWLEKPKSIGQFFNDESPSIKKLLTEIPQLKDKVLSHKSVLKFKDL